MELQLKSTFEIRIKHALNGGFVVNVGCAEFAYSSATQLCRDLKAYLEDPETYEKKYNDLIQEKHPQPTLRGGGINQVPLADMPEGETVTVAQAHEPPSLEGEQPPDESKQAETAGETES